MRKWIVAILVAMLCLFVLTMASADTGFTITETGTNELTMFKDAGIMECGTYFHVMFNAAGLDKSKPITLIDVSSPFPLSTYPVDYVGINGVDWWMSDPVTGEDYYGIIDVEVCDLQSIMPGDYTIVFTLSHNGQEATVSYLLHIVDAAPNTPIGVTGCEESYMIRPNETVTVTPVMQPTDWAGAYQTKMYFHAGKKDGNSCSYILSDEGHEYAVKTSNEGEQLLHYTFTDSSMEIIGIVPGFYKISITFSAPETNAVYYVSIPLTVLNADGTAPLYVPPIYYEIDYDFSGMNDSEYYYETVRYKSNLAISINCYMEDYENTGVLNDLVEATGLEALEGQAILTGLDGEEYVYEINGWQPYAQPG